MEIKRLPPGTDQGTTGLSKSILWHDLDHNPVRVTVELQFHGCVPILFGDKRHLQFDYSNPRNTRPLQCGYYNRRNTRPHCNPVPLPQFNYHDPRDTRLLQFEYCDPRLLYLITTIQKILNFYSLIIVIHRIPDFYSSIPVIQEIPDFYNLITVIKCYMY